MKKGLLWGLIAALLLLAVLTALFWPRIERAQAVSSLFSGAEQYENFNRMHEMFPTRRMPPAREPFVFPAGPAITLPERFTFEGSTGAVDTFLRETDTVALLVLNEGRIVYEHYWLTGGAEVTWLSMSVAKSFISALVGIAVDEGLIETIEAPITSYLPELNGSAYENVSIKNILQMSSGARWNEDYSDPDSDINRLGRIFALGGSMNEFAATLTREFEPGTYNRYNSVDTQVLGMLLVAATDRPIADYMAEKLWDPLGTATHAYWLLDADGMEMAFAGLNATARDYAKLGELYRLRGRWQGRQLVPEAWVRASVTPDAPHLMPGKDNPASDFPLGYGYQWWVPDGTDGEFSAIGVYNQFIYVNPAQDTVIVKLSANSAYGLTDDESSYRELETIEFFRAITASMKTPAN